MVAHQSFGIGVIASDINKMLIDSLRSEFPVWDHRRTDLLDHD
jgi:hypothetical protein